MTRARTTRTLWDLWTEPKPTPPSPRVSLSVRVLSSSSAGNCTVVTVRADDHANSTSFLIDAGLSPRRTKRLLADIGLCIRDITGVLYTHLDHDHCHAGWTSELAPRAWVRVHAHHARRAADMGLERRRIDYFDSEFDAAPGVRVNPVLLAHDGLGVAAFRFESASGSLGFVTDCGRITSAMIDTLAAVDTLVIESNYCPQMQADSARPDFLKQRIMGGSGHLSNQQCAHAARLIAPREHVVLVHLSRQCNTPDRAAAGHATAPYMLTIASHITPTPEIDCRRSTPVRA